MPLNKQIVLAARPQGMPKESDFRLISKETPPLKPGEFLVKSEYVSVDPYLRGVMTENRSYMDPFEIGGLIRAGAVGHVVESKHSDYKAGDVLLGDWGWQEYAVSNGRDMEIERVDTSLGPIATAIGVLGMPGMTAYF